MLRANPEALGYASQLRREANPAQTTISPGLSRSIIDLILVRAGTTTVHVDLADRLRPSERKNRAATRMASLSRLSGTDCRSTVSLRDRRPEPQKSPGEQATSSP
jgi:hypothetical protein